MTNGSAAVVDRVQDISPAFPPSMAGAPSVFAVELFVLLFVTLVSLATIWRLGWRLEDERVHMGHPLFYHRALVIGLLTSIAMGAGPNVVVSMMWGEVSGETMAVVLLCDRLLNALLIVPFILAFVFPAVARRLRRARPLAPLGDMVGDLKATWPTPGLPVRLALASAGLSISVASVKWLTWVG